MITVKNNCFHLATASTSYVFFIDQRGIAQHLHYGRRLKRPEGEVSALAVKRLVPRRGEASLSTKDWEVNLDDIPLEASSEGSGDYRRPFISIVRDGGSPVGLDLRYKSSQTWKGIRRMESGLVQAIAGEEDAQTLRLDLHDADTLVTLSLYYTVFPSCDVITRRAVVTNNSRQSISLGSIASLQLDLFASDWTVSFFGGPWGRELHRSRTALGYGTTVIESRSGFCGDKASTFILERGAEAIVTGLLYSGDHRATIETGNYGKVHILNGINTETTPVGLAPGESFETPEAFLVWAPSQDEAVERLHTFARGHVIRGVWKDRLRPVAFNTAFALGLDVRQNRVLEQVKLASRLGFELFVLDDGWFGVRNDGDSSIGDWSANTLKLPGGLVEISKECHKEGLLFGIWISPESIGIQSRLALEHPDWMVRSPRRKDSPVENGQFLLDLTREEVYEATLSTLKDLIERTGIDCLRWNLGTRMIDVWSRNGDSATSWRLRYIAAFSRLQRSLSVCFPNLMIENVSQTTGRFDLSLLSSSTLISANGLTDPFEQLDSLIGATTLVPPEAVSTMITPRRRNLEGRWTSFSSAFNIAIFGTPSWSIDLKALTGSQRKAILDQITFYKQYREALQYGIRRLVRNDNTVILTATSRDRSTILILLARRMMTANAEDDILYAPDADEDAVYVISRRAEEDEILMDDGLFSAPPLEEEVYTVSGDTLKWAGLRLVEQYQGASYSEEMRVMGDHSTRLYLATRVDKEER